MSVPRMSQLRQGSLVSIVLKADQPTGRLTTGTIADFLTRGDHPRGIKVRLRDGKIGRVHSLSSSEPTGQAQSSQNIPMQTLRSSAVAGSGLQQDYRTEEQPEEDVSLLDYVRVKPAKKPKGKQKGTNGNVEAAASQQSVESEASSRQQQMEAEYPDLDASLVAAILGDHGSPAAARSVLADLSQSLRPGADYNGL